MRSDAARRCRSTGGTRLGLSLVGDSETFPAPRAAPFQHNTAVLGCHTYPEAVGLLAAAGVRLEGALSFSHVETMNANRFALVVLQSRTRFQPTTSSMTVPFGLFP